MTDTRRRRGLLVRFLVVATLLSLLAACGSRSAAVVLTYERVWPDGYVEQQTIWDDGRVEMKHGQSLERMTLQPSELKMVEDALASPIPQASSPQSPARTLTVGSDAPMADPLPEPGTVTELLELLLDTHSIR